MINRVILVGRLTRDPMLRKTQSGLSVATFTVACDRRFSGGNGQDRQTDFISCVAWRQSADFLGQYAHKGAWSALTDGSRHGTMTMLPVRKCTSQKWSVTAYSCWNRNQHPRIVPLRWAISRRTPAMPRPTRLGTLRRTMDSMISALVRHWIFPAMTYHFN